MKNIVSIVLIISLASCVQKMGIRYTTSYKNNLFDECSSLTGNVISIENGSKIEGAKITILNTEYKTVTDSLGFFSMKDIPSGNNYILRVDYKGFNTLEIRRIKIERGYTTDIKISICPDYLEVD